MMVSFGAPFLWDEWKGILLLGDIYMELLRGAVDTDNLWGRYNDVVTDDSGVGCRENGGVGPV